MLDEFVAAARPRRYVLQLPLDHQRLKLLALAPYFFDFLTAYFSFGISD